MATGRDSLFMRKSTLFTEQVHSNDCKIQIKPKPYPLSLNRNTMHHHHSRYSLDSPRACQIKPFPYGQLKTNC